VKGEGHQRQEVKDDDSQNSKKVGYLQAFPLVNQPDRVYKNAEAGNLPTGYHHTGKAFKAKLLILNSSLAFIRLEGTLICLI
jgi:hypothetical protein